VDETLRVSWLSAIKSCFKPRVDAERVALQLLHDVLSPEQRAQYDRNGIFDVIGGQSGKRYRIRAGSQMNVEELNADGGSVRALCFVPKGGVPMGDILLAQKLALELMEEETLRVARPGVFLAQN
jgi:hypothetical protein